ncbi:MAG: hypothetical protein ACKPH7_24005 [Planktothrix sp.]|uniref:hypothetical protein n=1 Tax=Planktothrix sp. TaxID=3088171 RepID=UPI0038D3F9DF
MTTQFYQARLRLKGDLPSYFISSPLIMYYSKYPTGTLEAEYTLVINKIIRDEGDIEVHMGLWSDVRSSSATKLLSIVEESTKEEYITAFIEKVVTQDLKNILPFIQWPSEFELDWVNYKDHRDIDLFV